MLKFKHEHPHTFINGILVLIMAFYLKSISCFVCLCLCWHQLVKLYKVLSRKSLCFFVGRCFFTCEGFCFRVDVLLLFLCGHTSVCIESWRWSRWCCSSLVFIEYTLFMFDFFFWKASDNAKHMDKDRDLRNVFISYIVLSVKVSIRTVRAIFNYFINI